MKKLQWIVFILMIAVSATPAPGAYLESDEPGQAQETHEHEAPRPEPEQVAPPKTWPVPPRGYEPVLKQVRSLEVGEPCQIHGCTFYPLISSAFPGHQPRIAILEEALNQGLLDIHEKKQAQVAEIMVRNRSRQSVFIMAGEILVGGRQDRIVRCDVLLPLASGFLPVPVYCGEQHRWAGSKASFESKGHITGGRLRGMVATKESQEQVWQEIDRSLKQAGVASPTRDYQQVYDDERAQKMLDACCRGFRPLVRRNVVGVTALHHSRILGVDVFEDHDLFQRMWEKVIRSYAMDVIWEPPMVNRRLAPAPDILLFIRNILTARFTAEPTVGEGAAWSIRDHRLHGHALVLNGRPVHTAVYPKAPVRILQKRREHIVPQENE